MFVITSFFSFKCVCVSFRSNCYWADSTSHHTCCEINARRTQRSRKLVLLRSNRSHTRRNRLNSHMVARCTVARPRLPLAVSHRLDSRQHKEKSQMQADNTPPHPPPSEKKPKKNSRQRCLWRAALPPGLGSDQRAEAASTLLWQGGPLALHCRCY